MRFSQSLALVLSRRLVPTCDRYMIGTWLLGSELELTWFPYIFDRDVYIQQVLLIFRRHGLRGSLDNLEQL
jgi:hypothetical protein